MSTRHDTDRRRDGRGLGPGAPDVRARRGAILVQVAIMLVGLTGLSAFVVDYGILWVARRQIQNAADAAALAAAVSLGFDAPGDLTRARENAQTAAAQNPVWGEPASMAATDITFPPCPTGSVGTGTCVRVDAFRDRTHGSQLPTIFAALVGVRHQGVRATATAQVLFGNTTDCVRPIAIPDRWLELRNDVGDAGWDPLDTFDRYASARVLLPPPVDTFIPPSGPGANGTGYSRAGVPGNPIGDLGRQVRFAAQLDLSLPVGGEYFVPIRVTPGANGPLDMLRDMTSCSPHVIGPGDRLEVETGDSHFPTRTGMEQILAADPDASWDPAMNGGRGGIAGGCMSTGACTVSPRIIPVVAFDPDHWSARAPSQYVIVDRIIGLFIEAYVPRAFTARMIAYPAAPRSSMTADPASAFVVSVTLVR